MTPKPPWMGLKLVKTRNFSSLAALATEFLMPSQNLTVSRVYDQPSHIPVTPVVAPYGRKEVHKGVVDCGLPRGSTGPFHEGVVDCGLSGRSTGPFHKGVVDCGLVETPKPFTRGGVLQSDVHITTSTATVWNLSHSRCSTEVLTEMWDPCRK